MASSSIALASIRIRPNYFENCKENPHIPFLTNPTVAGFSGKSITGLNSQSYSVINWTFLKQVHEI